MKYYIGIDLGGTNLAAGVVREDGQIVARESIPTRHGSAAVVVEDMVSTVRSLTEKSGISLNLIQSVGVGVPGTANRESGMIEYANNLSFSNEPLAQMLSTALNKPVIMENDANAAAWGEYLAGSGRGSSSFVMVTLGTGIGGAMIFDGRLYTGTNYSAGEFGHFVINFDGDPCNCGRRGCFETYASAAALVRQTRRAMEKHPESRLWQLCGGDLERVEGKTVMDGADLEDETAKEVLSKYIDYLGVGICDIINSLQPDVLCIGGGISKAGDLLLLPLKKAVDCQIYTRDSKQKTAVVMAGLGNDAGILGAAFLDRTL